MAPSSEKKSKVVIIVLNILVFMFFFSLALRTSLLKDLHDLANKINLKIDGILGEFSSPTAFVGAINRLSFVGNNMFLFNIIYTSVFLLTFFVILILGFLYFFACFLKKQSALYFNKSNSKRFTYISLSRLLC